MKKNAEGGDGLKIRWVGRGTDFVALKSKNDPILWLALQRGEAKWAWVRSVAKPQPSKPMGADAVGEGLEAKGRQYPGTRGAVEEH